MALYQIKFTNVKLQLRNLKKKKTIISYNADTVVVVIKTFTSGFCFIHSLIIGIAVIPSPTISNS